MRLSPDGYRAVLLADAARLWAAAAASAQAPVATCPGWVSRDVVDHVSEVYAQGRGAPGDVYRSLWNRLAPDVTREGDPPVLQRFLARLGLGMS